MDKYLKGPGRDVDDAAPDEIPRDFTTMMSSGRSTAEREDARQQEIRAAAARGRARHSEEHAMKYLEMARRAAHGGDTAEARKATKKAMSVIRGMSNAAYELSHFARTRETQQIAEEAVVIADRLTAAANKVESVALHVEDPAGPLARLRALLFQSIARLLEAT